MRLRRPITSASAPPWDPNHRLTEKWGHVGLTFGGGPSATNFREAL
jgi:hypothetical protein